VGYLVGAVIVIFLIVEAVRGTLRALSLIGRALSSVAHGIGHAASDSVAFLAWVTPRIAAAAVLLGLLWMAWWLATEAWYVLRDKRVEQGWFDQIGPRIAVAMALGEPCTLVSLTAPPRSPAFGRGAAHPWTPPIPRSLQRLVDAGGRAAGLSTAPYTARQPLRSDDAAGTAPSSARRERHYPTRSRAQERHVPADLNHLLTLAKLGRIRELVDAGAHASASLRVIADVAADRERASDWSGKGQEIRDPRLDPPARGVSRAHEEQPSIGDARLAADGGKGRVIVDGSRAVQVGSDNRQYNFHTYEVVTPKIEDLAKRLRDHDVAAAARGLAADPENAAARRELLNRLAPGGLGLGGPTTRLQITALRSGATRSGSWLDGTVIFRHVSGGQAGNGNVQRNEFVYVVTPGTSARETLASNRDLAKALIDCAFPEHGRGDVAKLSERFASAVKGARIGSADGRIRDRHYEQPEAGATLRIRAHDGVSVGDRSTIASESRVVAQGPPSVFARSAIERETARLTRAARAEREAAEIRRDHASWEHGITRDGPSGGMSAR
jgi:hypothetical protein